MELHMGVNIEIIVYGAAADQEKSA